jgi:GAF domain-containing protein
VTPTDQDAARLQAILGAFYAGSITRDDARSSVIDIVLERIGCARVSLWKFDGVDAGDGEMSLLCFASKVAGGSLDRTESTLRQGEYREYFNALTERGTFATADALQDPILQPMRESYLLPNRIVSLLDAAFMLNGRAYGMVCCEETAARRDWRTGDVLALRAIVTRLALIMSGQPESLLWTTPSRPLRAIAAASPSPRD